MAMSRNKGGAYRPQQWWDRWQQTTGITVPEKLRRLKCQGKMRPCNVVEHKEGSQDE